MIGLSPREIEVARCMCDYLSNREVADRLCISPKTVETHVRNIALKLGLKSDWPSEDEPPNRRIRLQITMAMIEHDCVPADSKLGQVLAARDRRIACLSLDRSASQ